MNSRRLYSLARTGMLAVAFFIGCNVFGAVEPKEFVNSSADVNSGTVHQTVVLGMDMNKLLLLFNDLAGKRGLVVINKLDCSDTQCRLVYKSSGENKSMSYSTTTTSVRRDLMRPAMSPSYQPFPDTTVTTHSDRTINLAYSSKYFISFSRQRGADDAITIEMVGVPVLNQEMSCPPGLLSAFITCTPPVINGIPDVPLSESLSQNWGYDVSGVIEADVINGIFAELSMMLNGVDSLASKKSAAPVSVNERDTAMESASTPVTSVEQQ